MSEKPKYTMQSAGLSSRPGDTHNFHVVYLQTLLQRYELVFCPDRSEIVSTCTSTLLIVVLDGLADGVVDDKPYVRLVNAHAKRHRGYHHLGQHIHVHV